MSSTFMLSYFLTFVLSEDCEGVAEGVGAGCGQYWQQAVGNSGSRGSPALICHCVCGGGG